MKTRKSAIGPSNLVAAKASKLINVGDLRAKMLDMVRDRVIKASLYENDEHYTSLFNFISDTTKNKLGSTELFQLLGQNGILGNMYLVEFENLVETLHLELNSSPLYKATPKRYIHPGYFKVAQKIRKSGIDIEREMKKRDRHKTGYITRDHLKGIFSMLEVELTEREISGMQDELDPFCTNKVSIKDI